MMPPASSLLSHLQAHSDATRLFLPSPRVSHNFQVSVSVVFFLARLQWMPPLNSSPCFAQRVLSPVAFSVRRSNSYLRLTVRRTRKSVSKRGGYLNIFHPLGHTYYRLKLCLSSGLYYLVYYIIWNLGEGVNLSVEKKTISRLVQNHQLQSL